MIPDLTMHFNDYKDDAIYLSNPSQDFILKIEEGSGDNLDLEDIGKGYVDYWYIEGIDHNGCEYGGGFLYQKELIRDKNPTIEEIINDIKSTDQLDDPEIIKTVYLIDTEVGEQMYNKFSIAAQLRIQEQRAEILRQEIEGYEER